MPAEKSYARLGFFIVIAIAAVLATAIFFIQRFKSRESIPMVTYTKESAYGLDVSSPVRLRGVPVGRVTEIRVDPKGTLVEINFEVFLDHLNTIGLDVKRLRTLTDTGGTFPRLRAQILGNPMSGEAYLLLVQPDNPPPPMELGFKPARSYVPSIPSPFAAVQDRLPDLLRQADATLKTLQEIVARVPPTLDHTEHFLANVDRTIKESQLPALSADSRRFFTTTSVQVEGIRANIENLAGSQGALIKFSNEARAAIREADLPAMGRAAREAADNSRLASDDLRRTLPPIRESIEQMRDLSRRLEEQPESVVYGPRPSNPKKP